MRINATENSNVSIDTRINFVNGGFCNMTKKIRILTVRNGQGEQLYLCSNLTTFSNQLCDDTEKFKVDQQQPCTGPDITLCKYDMKLILLNFGPSDEGLYNVEVEFENDGRGRGMLMLQFNITLSNEDTPTEMPNTGKLHTVYFVITKQLVFGTIILAHAQQYLRTSQLLNLLFTWLA